MCAVMLLQVPQVTAEEPLPPRPGLYTGQTLVAVEGAVGPPAGDLTDQPCSVRVMREGERLVATSSFLPGVRVTLTRDVERPNYWGAVGEKAEALVVWTGEEGLVGIATHTVIEADGRPAHAVFGGGTFFRECLIRPGDA